MKAVLAAVLVMALAVVCLVPAESADADYYDINGEKNVIGTGDDADFRIVYINHDYDEYQDMNMSVSYTASLKDSAGETVSNGVSPSSGDLDLGQAQTLTVSAPDEPGRCTLEVAYEVSVSYTVTDEEGNETEETEEFTRNDTYEINVVESFQDVESAEDAETLKTLTNTTVSQQRIEVGRERLSNIILEDASKYTDTYGITLEDVIIRQIRYSDDLTESVYERMIKERNQIAETYRSYGRGQLAEWRGQTERDRQTILSQAEAEAARIRGEADAEAARIYAESYSANPDFFELYNSLESYKVTLPATDKVLSTDGEYFKYL